MKFVGMRVCCDETVKESIHLHVNFYGIYLAHLALPKWACIIMIHEMDPNMGLWFRLCGICVVCVCSSWPQCKSHKLHILQINLNLNLRHLYSAPHEPCEGFQVCFTLLAAQANHLTVSHQYEKEPPSPRSTPWGAYRSASLMRRRSSFHKPSVLPFTHTLTHGNCR